MIDLYEELKKIVAKFNEEGVDYALCGGFAVIVHGYTRATEDIDFLIKSEDLAQAEEILDKLGFDLRTGEIPLSEEKSLFRRTKVEGNDYLIIDLVLVAKGDEDIWESRKYVNWEGKSLRIVSKNALIKMKRRAGRPQDFLDIENLKKEKDKYGE